jgi:protein tyrosine phosphatase (PTP) superfamily phosphohydrolase (DUF442 family)
MKATPLVLLALGALLATACTTKTVSGSDDEQALSLGLPNAVLVEPHLIASGQPSPDQLAALPALGYRTLIQLRPLDEDGTGWEEERGPAVGVRVVRIPCAGAEGLTEENARALDGAMAEAGSGGVVVACASGNRVGGLLALRAYFVTGASPEEALELGKRAGLTRAEPAVRKQLGL